MEYEHLRYEQDGPVTVITIDRPERMNAVAPRTAEELVDAWTRFRDDDGALVGILTGAGDEAFCAGADLKAAFAGDMAVPLSQDERDAHARGERPGLLGPTRWTDLYKPTIAAVNGVAYAGGLEWACWTDLCIADEHATFGVTCRRWNIGLGDGGTQRLPRIVGQGRALDLVLSGRTIEAAEAHAIGLVTEVVRAGAHVERALEMADGLAAFPQDTMLSDRRALLEGSGRPLADGLVLEAELGREVLATAVEGAARFAGGAGRSGTGTGV
jgi:enoyl-CoA hydratase